MIVIILIKKIRQPIGRYLINYGNRENPDDISTPIDVAKEKVSTQSQVLGVDVNINEEQEEDLAVNVDPETGEVEIDLNEDSGKVLASIGGRLLYESCRLDGRRRFRRHSSNSYGKLYG